MTPAGDENRSGSEGWRVGFVWLAANCLHLSRVCRMSRIWRARYRGCVGRIVPGDGEGGRSPSIRAGAPPDFPPAERRRWFGPVLRPVILGSSPRMTGEKVGGGCSGRRSRRRESPHRVESGHRRLRLQLNDPDLETTQDHQALLLSNWSRCPPDSSRRAWFR